MRKALCCIFALFTGMGVFAQQPVVAVAPFDAISGISSTDANMITRVFFIRLGNTGKVSLVDRGVVERVLKEHSFQAGDWSNQQKTAELGKALNTDWIVRGELEKFGNNVLVTVQFYDIQTFRFMGGADLRLANADEAYDKMDPLVDKLVQTIANAGERTSRTQGGNAAASAYYGTWLYHGSGFTDTFIIDANKITLRRSTGPYIVISNCTWTAENNSDIKTLADYPKGFKVSGTVTDNKDFPFRIFMPLYLFMHKSDSNKMYRYYTPDSNSEVQYAGQGPFGKIQ
ncbi:MAG: penicillin-binding protein activator LpoB [Treponema sp.]|jgi:TolB-like protein|nr:penicillin-binding protein activator LpoB [Treponema sp.]